MPGDSFNLQSDQILFRVSFFLVAFGFNYFAQYVPVTAHWLRQVIVAVRATCISRSKHMAGWGAFSAWGQNTLHYFSDVHTGISIWVFFCVSVARCLFGFVKHLYNCSIRLRDQSSTGLVSLETLIETERPSTKQQQNVLSNGNCTWIHSQRLRRCMRAALHRYTPNQV